MLVLKITLLNACEIKKFWPLCLQPAELYYILLVFSCWMENLLNKSDTKKCLSTLRMKRVFINVWMNKMVLLLKVSWSGYKVGMNWKTVNPFRTFRIEFREWLCPFLPQGHWLIVIWTWLAGTRVSWWCPIFHEIACIKKNYFKKTIISLVSFGIPQFATDSHSLWGNFLVYVLLVGFEPESFWFGM